MGIDVPLQPIDGTHVSGECISGIAVAEKRPDYPTDSQPGKVLFYEHLTVDESKQKLLCLRNFRTMLYREYQRK
jgi:hypothetical protein